jgi:hypothetical protein
VFPPSADVSYETSTISLDALGGISRLDYYIFTYTFTSTELVKKKTSLIACCVVESSAVVKDLDENTLRVIINRAFRQGNIPFRTLAAIYAQLITAVKGPTAGLPGPSIKEQEELEFLYRPELESEDAEDGASPSKPAEIAA